MSGGMVSEQFPISSGQVHIEAVSRNSDVSEITNLMEMGTKDLPYQIMPVPSMHSGLMASGLTSQHVDTSNELMGVPDSVSFNFVPQPVSCHPSSLMDSQFTTLQVQPSPAHQYNSGGLMAALNSPGSSPLIGKRKSPLELVLHGSLLHNLDLPNKRVAQMQHRPWLQQLSPSSNGSVHIPTSSLSPKTHYTPVLSKKAVQMESVPGKAGKQLTNKKQHVQSQALKKMQNEGNESVRSKMRESLVAALALLQQQDNCIGGKKSSQTEEPRTMENSQSVEPATASGIDTPPAVDGIIPTLSNGDESSGKRDSDGRMLMHEAFSDMQMKDANQSNEQRSEFDEVFPRDNVPFSDSIFSSDELLRGNGLSWVLEPVIDLGETKDNETDSAPKSGDGNCERTDGEKLLQDPELLASKIEIELFKLFGGVNKKYKEKGRSLLFNLKDKNNPDLREEVVFGKIPPVRLCSMTTEELASKELSQWRQAKAEEMAQMVVLQDTDIDVRRLVRKTHKGEFQVEIDPVDSGSVDVSASVSSRTKPRLKAKATKPAKSAWKKDETKDTISKGELGTSCTITIPSSWGNDPMHGLSMDDEMQDVGFLPPIVSLDEFMESLNSEPPFETPQEGSGKEASVHEKSDSEVVSSSPSPREPSEKDSPKSRPVKFNVDSPKPDASVLSNDDFTKPENTNVVAAIKGEKVWDGILQLSISSVVSVTGIFKSGEKTQTSEWPALVEVKGRVRLSAFAKFLQELPMSRSRALMVMYLVCNDGISESQRGGFYEAAESYVADGRVGYAEPTSGAELYLCPPRGETLDLLLKIIPKDHLDEVKRFDIGLIGIVVWRRPLLSHSRFKRKHSSSSRSSNKSSTVAHVSNKKTVVGLNNERAVASPGTHGGVVDDDDDVPPGFGPGVARDDDDLPEFSFDTSGGSVSSSRPPPQQPPPESRSMDQVRELIHKYGVGNLGIQPWYNVDDDDEDIPEWQPPGSGHQLQPSTTLRPPSSYGTEIGSQVHSRTAARPLMQSGGQGSANKNAAGKPYGVPQPRNRGFS